ncbi:periplasmic binding protein-like I [Umbelopsis sp. PMI_123]|nr:periplasmic binding protein-like I [Umbelopsis sp. PMI_123]
MADGIISSQLSQDNTTIVSLTVNHTTEIRPVDTAGKVELKIGVLLPFQQVDDEWTKTITVSGMSAIRMAAAEINSQQLIPGAYITLVEKDSYPSNATGQTAITEAVYSAVTLIQQGVIGVIGDISSSWTSLSGLMTSTLQIPQCSFSAGATSLSDKSQYKYFFRTIPTDLVYVDVILSFIASQDWGRVGILFSDDAFGQQLSEHAIMKSRTSNIRVLTYQAFRSGGGHSNIMTVLQQFVETGARIVIVAADLPDQISLLTIAANMGYVNNDFVWLTIGSLSDELYLATQRFNNLIALRQNGTISPAPQNASAISLAARLTNNVTPIDFNTTFNGMISFDIWLDLDGYPPYEAFLDKWSRLDSTE